MSGEWICLEDIVAAKKAAAEAKKFGKKAPRAKKLPTEARQSKKPSTRKKKPAEEASTAPADMT